MQIWYINHYATPPANGSFGRPYALAKSFQKKGHGVTVFCASYHHLRQVAALPDDLYRISECDGVGYYHLPARSYSGNGLARVMNMIDFSREIGRLSKKINCGEIAPPDIVIPSCVHPLVFPPARKLARKYRAKLIYEVRDIWPLSLVELSGVSPFHPVVLWFGWIERQAYRHADAVVSLLPNALKHMAPRGLDKEKFYFIPNGINREEWGLPPVSLPEEHRRFFHQLRTEGKLIVVYAGAHGPPNALDQILNLSKLDTGKTKPYHFACIGDGLEKEKLMRRVSDDAISFVTFLPKITKQQVISALALADVCFIASPKKKIYTYGTSPNKLGDYFMSCKPVLNALDTTGNDLVRDAGAGITVEPYNAAQLEDALMLFCEMSEGERKKMGENGRKYALKNLDWDVLGGRYAAICESLF